MPHAGGGGGRAYPHYSPRVTNVGGGQVYLWVPPPLPPSAEVMQCAGGDVSAGAPQDFVLASCGAPASTRQVVYMTSAGPRVIDVWTFERANVTTRTLRFENGIVTSIDTVRVLSR